MLFFLNRLPMVFVCLAAVTCISNAMSQMEISSMEILEVRLTGLICALVK